LISTRYRRPAIIAAAAALISLVTACASSPAPSSSTGATSSGTANAAPGVTKNSIQLALIDTATGPASAGGGSTGAARGAKAYVAYINSLGGVNGRKIDLTVYDDQSSPTEAGAICTRVIPSVFALVAGTSFGDSGCAQQVASSGIPDVGLQIDTAAYYPIPNALWMENGNPKAIPLGPYQEIHSLYPSVSKIAFMYSNVPSTQALATEQADALTADHYDIVYNVSLPPTTTSFTPYILQAMQHGAKGVFTYGLDVTATARIAQAMQQQNFNTPVKYSNFSYNSSFQSLAGSAAVGWLDSIRSVPYLDPSEVSAFPDGNLFLTWYRKVNGNAPIDVFVPNSWASMAYFVQGLKKAGANPTRASVLAALKSITSYDAGGVVNGPGDPGNKSVSPCFLITEATASGYIVRDPSQLGQYDCSHTQFLGGS
jgi:branched-chain amino acid transport system substrate-binding protein